MRISSYLICMATALLALLAWPTRVVALNNARNLACSADTLRQGKDLG